MKIKFERQCIGPKDHKACSIPFSIGIAFPRTSAEYKAAHWLTGQADAFMQFCPFTQWERIIEFLREYHPHADHETALEKIRAAMKEWTSA